MNGAWHNVSATDTRPAWARNLPARETLAYTQTLLVTAGLVLLALYLAAKIAANPTAAVRAAREKTGV